MGQAGSLGPHVLNRSLQVGRVMLIGGLRASLYWPPLTWHLWLREERRCCLGHSTIMWGVPIHGLVRPRPTVIQMAPMRLLRTHSWNVVRWMWQHLDFRS